MDRGVQEANTKVEPWTGTYPNKELEDRHGCKILRMVWRLETTVATVTIFLHIHENIYME